MAREDKIEMTGKVVDVIKGGKFIVEFENNRKVTATLSGRLRSNFIRILRGDMVTVQISPYDLTKGIITWREK
jgi:translation initiation factor IF-1